MGIDKLINLLVTVTLFEMMVSIGLGVTFSLFAHQAPFFVNGVTLPGEPLAYGLVSLGFRYGVP